MYKSLIFLGDVFLPQKYNCEIISLYNVIFNLEAPISSNHLGIPDKINLKTENCFIEETFGCKPLAVCLANNHIADFGDVGLSETFETLDKMEIKYFGAGSRFNNYNNPLMLKEIGVSLHGYCGTKDIAKLDSLGLTNRPAPLDYELIVRDIDFALNHSLSPIVQLHWGREESAWPMPEQVRMARELIGIGAEMILFHHAHSIQPIEYYKGKLIAYCLGNFMFDDFVAPKHYNQDGVSHSSYEKNNHHGIDLH